MISIIVKTLTAVACNCQHRLQMIMDTDGAYMENVFTCLSFSQDLLSSEAPNTVMFDT